MGKYDELVSDLHQTDSGHPECDQRIRKAATAITTLEAELAAMKAENDELRTWRDAVDDHLVASCLGTWESFPDAATAMNRLLEWETTIALDPKVSKAAHDLIAAMKARGDGLANFAETIAEFGSDTSKELARQALAEWRDQ